MHGARPGAHAHDAVAMPVVQTATYAFETSEALRAYVEGRHDREEYGRYGNPTVRLLEARMAALEGAEDAVAFGSGMAAITAVLLALLRAGAHVVLFDDCYRRTRQLVAEWLGRFGVQATLVPGGDVAAMERALRPETRVVLTEAPTNPFLLVADLPAIASVCRPRRIRTVVDATLASPVNLRPLEHGIDLVVHSATKYLAGHNDVLGGVVAGSGALVSLVREVRDVTGAMLDPHAGWLVLRGLKTLALRVQRQNATGLALARALEGHPRVVRVWYPGLQSHPSHAIATRLMRGFGGVVSFELRAGFEETMRFVDDCRLARIAPSFGGVESLVEQPALMSYHSLDREERLRLGITDGLVRFSAGIEDTQEIVADVLRALQTSA
ncbi:MAG: aminotransferase class I/II-fold pyridoxal phosphate-dependent enzyme [Myxococcota bacterium]|nr:aminotransferase class I/II-fold pyridoxal phosphate-dependent enzyme [Myxococcota bacterium]